MTGRLLNRIARCRRGGSAVEFALLAPVFIGLMIGVVEVGVYMQNYNAIRSLAGDASRFAAVEYQKNNVVAESTLEDNITAMGIASPYNLNPSLLVVEVDEVTPARVNGAREFDLTITYSLPDILEAWTIDNITLTYSRPLFVLDS